MPREGDVRLRGVTKEPRSHEEQAIPPQSRRDLDALSPRSGLDLAFFRLKPADPASISPRSRLDLHGLLGPSACMSPARDQP